MYLSSSLFDKYQNKKREIIDADNGINLKTYSLLPKISVKNLTGNKNNGGAA